MIVSKLSRDSQKRIYGLDELIDDGILQANKELIGIVVAINKAPQDPKGGGY
jgi:hypothetical protein